MLPQPGLRHHRPRWVYIVGGAVVLVGGYLVYRSRQNSSSTSTGASTSTSASAPTLESTGFTSNITDTSNNLPYEDTWPYNQLALPYNYNGSTSATVNSNANDVMPYAPGSTLTSPVGG